MSKHATILCALLFALCSPAFADNVFTEDLGLNPPLDTAAVDSEGDELDTRIAMFSPSKWKPMLIQRQ